MTCTQVEGQVTSCTMNADDAKNESKCTAFAAHMECYRQHCTAALNSGVRTHTHTHKLKFDRTCFEYALNSGVSTSLSCVAMPAIWCSWGPPCSDRNLKLWRVKLKLRRKHANCRCCAPSVADKLLPDEWHIWNNNRRKAHRLLESLNYARAARLQRRKHPPLMKEPLNY